MADPDMMAVDEGASSRTPPYEGVLANSELTEAIFAFSSPGAIFCFGKTSRTSYGLVKSYAARVWNVDRHLSRFFSDPRASRELQARTGTLVSGSNALQFFDRSFYPESDLDVYLHRGREREAGNFLLADGYTFQPTPRQFEELSEQERNIWNRDQRPFRFPIASSCFRSAMDLDEEYKPAKSWGLLFVLYFRKTSVTGAELKVQLLIAEHSPMEAILRFHSTCVMNVISYNRAYSLYPRATFDERETLLTPRNPEHRDIRFHAIQKYKGRGWRVVQQPSLRNEPLYAFGSRWIDDRYSWVIDLPPLPTSAPPPTPLSRPLPQDPVAATNWALIHPSEPVIDYYVVIGADLQYDYVLSDLELFAHLREKLWHNLLAQYTREVSEESRQLSPANQYSIRTCLDADFIDRCADYRARMESEHRQPVVYQDQESHVSQRQRRFMWTRGWQLVDTILPDDEHVYAIGARWIDDARSWVISLPIPPGHPVSPTILSDPLHDDPIAATNWALLDTVQPYITYRILASPSLHDSYVISDLEFYAHLREKLWRSIFSEYMKGQGEYYAKLTACQRYDIRVCVDAQVLVHSLSYRQRMKSEGRSPVVYQLRGAYIKPAKYNFAWESICGHERLLRPLDDSYFVADFDSITRRKEEYEGF